MKSEKTKIEESIECIAESTMKQCKKIIELETKIAEQTEENTRLESINKSLDAIIASLSKENEKLRNAEQLDDKEEIKRLQEQIETYSVEIYNLNSQIINKNYQIEVLSKENEKLRNSEQISDKEEIQGLQKQIESYSEDIKKLRLQISSKNTQIIECEQRIEVLDNRNKKLSESLSNYKEIEKVFKSLNSKNKAYQNFIYEMMCIELKGDLDNESEPETN